VSSGEESARPVGWASSPFFWLALAAGALACFLYYPFFFPESHQRLTHQSEEFFFEANEAAGAPVLVLSAWLFYRRSHYLDLLRGPGEPLFGALVLIMTTGLFTWGHFTASPDLQLASAIGLAFGAALCLGGRVAARAYWIPILFLVFALPIPPVLLSWAMYPVQLLTAEYAGAILNFIGVKSLVQGDQILRPENTFVVIESCSGVRTVLTLSMLTVLLIDLFERRGKHAAILFVLAPLVAFVTNGFRVVTLVLNPHSSIHSIHNLQGVAMLLVGLTLMYVLDLALERVLGSAGAAADLEHDSADYGAVSNAAEGDEQGDSRARAIRVGLVVAALLAMLGVGRVLTPYTPPHGITEMPDALLTRVFGEGATQVITPDFQFRGSIRYLAHSNRAMRVAGEPLEVFLGVANESLRSHTVLSKRLAWPSSGFVAEEETFVDLADDARGVRRMVLRRGGRSILSYSWYPRAGSLAAEGWRQALALDRSPLIRDEHMLAVRISTEIVRGEGRLEEAEARIRKAWERLAPELVDYGPVQIAQETSSALVK